MPTRFKGVILAGVHQWVDSGLGRLIPRPLVPVVDRPLIEHVVTWIQGAGVTKATVCANSDTSTIRRSLGDGAPHAIAIDYCEDYMPRGPAGCVKDAAASTDVNYFVVVDATVLPWSINLPAMLEAHVAAGVAMTVAVTRLGESSRPDNGHMIPAGVYIFSRRALDHVSAAGYQDIKESLIPKLYAAGERVVTHVIHGRVPRVACTSTYLSACMWQLDHRLAQAPDGDRDYVRNGSALIHRTATVDPSVQLIGPVLVGPQTTVAAGAKIVGPTTVGPKCVVEEDVILCRSHVWEGARIESGSALDRCVVTFGATIPGETRQSNRVFTSRRRERRRHGRPLSHAETPASHA